MDIIARYLEPLILEALETNPVVFVNGPRQAGKSTLVQHLAKTAYPADYVTFDNPTQMAAATSAPYDFLINRKSALIIDEVQLVPDLFRVLKMVVDEQRLRDGDAANGKFLLTGSANILALPKLSDALVGRMRILTLYPCAVAEVINRPSTFLHHLFAGEFDVDKDHFMPLPKAMSLATFPKIIHKTAKEQAGWFDDYLTTLIQRDVRMLAELEKISLLPRLLTLLAGRSGHLINDADLARDLGLNPVTTKQYRTILQMLFLTFELRPWFRNISKRLVKSAKNYMVDTLLLCHLLGVKPDKCQETHPHLWGHIVENFVAAELLKLLSWHETRLYLYHFRTSDGQEIDFILESPDGKLAAIEVKAREFIDQKDFKSIKEFQAQVGDDLVCGIVLYLGRDIVPFGKNLWAVPMAALWQ